MKRVGTGLLLLKLVISSLESHKRFSYKFNYLFTCWNTQLGHSWWGIHLKFVIFSSRAYSTVFAETDDIENRIQIEFRDLRTKCNLSRHRNVIIISHFLWENKRRSVSTIWCVDEKVQRRKSPYLLMSINHQFIILRPNPMFPLYSTSFVYSSGIILGTS